MWIRVLNGIQGSVSVIFESAVLNLGSGAISIPPSPPPSLRPSLPSPKAFWQLQGECQQSALDEPKCSFCILELLNCLHHFPETYRKCKGCCFYPSAFFSSFWPNCSSHSDDKSMNFKRTCIAISLKGSLTFPPDDNPAQG